MILIILKLKSFIKMDIYIYNTSSEKRNEEFKFGSAWRVE